VDDLAVTVHRAYGLMPNMTWVIDRGGVAYKANWTSAANVEAFQGHRAPAVPAPGGVRDQVQRRPEQRLGQPQPDHRVHGHNVHQRQLGPAGLPGGADRNSRQWGTRRCGHHQAHGGAGALIEEARRGTR